MPKRISGCLGGGRYVCCSPLTIAQRKGNKQSTSQCQIWRSGTEKFGKGGADNFALGRIQRAQLLFYVYAWGKHRFPKSKI